MSSQLKLATHSGTNSHGSQNVTTEMGGGFSARALIRPVPLHVRIPAHECACAIPILKIQILYVHYLQVKFPALLRESHDRNDP